MGFPHVYHPYGLNTTLLPQVCVLENSWQLWELWVEHTFQGQGRGLERQIAWVQLTGQLAVKSS